MSTALEVLISLIKKSSDWWPFLMSKADKLPMFSTDFNRCQEVTNGKLGLLFDFSGHNLYFSFLQLKKMTLLP